MHITSGRRPIRPGRSSSLVRTSVSHRQALTQRSGNAPRRSAVRIRPGPHFDGCYAGVRCTTNVLAGKWRSLLWTERRVYPLVEVIPLTAEEALTTDPFYLDMTENAIMIYDREMFFARKLDDLKARLERIGACKSVLPSGQWFWVLAKDASAAGKLIL